MAQPSPLSRQGALQVGSFSDSISSRGSFKQSCFGLPPPPCRDTPERFPARRPFPPVILMAPLSITGRSLTNQDRSGVARSWSSPALWLGSDSASPRRASKLSRSRLSLSQPTSPLGDVGSLGTSMPRKASDASLTPGSMMVVGASDSKQFDEELAALFGALSSGRTARAGKVCVHPWARFLEDAYRDYGCEKWGFDPVPLSSVATSGSDGTVSWEEFRRWQHQWLATLAAKDSSKAAMLCWLAAEVRLSLRVKEAAESCAGDDTGLVAAVASIARRGPSSREASRVLDPVRERLKKRMGEAAKAGDTAAWNEAAALAVQAEMPRLELDAAKAHMTALREAKGITLDFTFPGGDRTSLRAFPRETVGELKARLLAARGSPQHAHVQMSVGSRLLSDDEPAARLERLSPLLAVLGFDGAALAAEAGRLVDSISRFKEAVAEVMDMGKPPTAVHVCCEVLLCLLSGQEGAASWAAAERRVLGAGSFRVPEDLSPPSAYRPMLGSPGLYVLLKRFPELVAAGSVPEENFKAARVVSNATWQDVYGGTAKLNRESLARMNRFCAVMAEWSQLVLKYHELVSP